MAAVDKDFVIKQGLKVLGSNASVNGSDIITAEMLVDGTHTGISATYDADTKALVLTVDAGDAAIDVVAAALKLGTNELDDDGNPKVDFDPTNITVTYTEESVDNTDPQNPIVTPASIRLEAAPGYTDEEARAAISVALESVLRYDSEDGEFDLALADGKGLEKVDSTTEFEVDVDGNPTNTAKKELAVKAGDGISVGTTGVGVKLDEDGSTTYSGLNVDADGLSVKFGSDAGLGTGEDGLYVKLEAEKGLSVGADGLSAVVGDGIKVDVDGIAVDYANGLTLDVDSKLVIDTDVVVTVDDTQTLTNKTLGFVDPDTEEAFVTTLGANLDADGFRVTGLASPESQDDAATKAYVDAVAEGLHIHESVSASTVEPIDLLTPLSEIDGVTLIEGMRVLVKDQTDASENGIYVVGATGALERAADFDSPSEIDSGDFVFVSGGSTNGGTGWVQVNTVGTVGTDPLEFTQFSGAGTYLAGNGLELDGTTFSIDEDVVATKTYVGTEIDDAITAAFTPEGGYVAGDYSSLSSSMTDFGTAQNSALLVPVLDEDLSNFDTGLVVFKIAGETWGASVLNTPAAMNAVRIALPGVTGYEYADTAADTFSNSPGAAFVTAEYADGVTVTVNYAMIRGNRFSGGMGPVDLTLDEVMSSLVAFIVDPNDLVTPVTKPFGLTGASPAALTIDQLVTVDALADALANSESGTLDEVNDLIAFAITEGDVSATPAYQAINIADISKQVASEVSIATADTTMTAYDWDGLVYKSGEFLVRATYNDGVDIHTELVKVLCTLSGTSTYITQYGMVSTTGEPLVNVDVVFDGVSTLELQVTAEQENTDVTVTGTLLK